MIAVLTAGALLGTGAWLLIRVCVGAPRSLSRDLARLALPAWPDIEVTTSPRARWTQLLARAGGLGGSEERLAPDLELVGRSPERLAVERCLSALALGVMPVVLSTMLTTGGLAISVGLIGVSAATFAAAGWVVPALTLQREATQRRRTARHALGAYLDVVAILLAGGHGPTGALVEAARIGEGWLFIKLRSALDHAAATGQPPWAEIARLAERTSLTDLFEFATAMSLAEGGGAAVRSTLLAKAETLRTKALADAEAAAHRSSELLVIPTVALLVAFMLLIGFPAAYRIMGF